MVDEGLKHPSGTVTWLDLVTTDLTDASAFYEGLFGWHLVADRSATGLHLVGEVEHHSVAGMLASDAGDSEADHIARWTVFFRVERLEDSLGVVQAVGGSVLMEPAAAAEGVRVGLVADPSGALFGLVEQDPNLGLDDVVGEGTFALAELEAPSLSNREFYELVFHWATDPHPDGKHLTFYRTGQPVARMAVEPEHTPRWIAYFRVADLEESCSRAEWLGGSVRRRIDESRALITDPEGAVVGITTGWPHEADGLP